MLKKLFVLFFLTIFVSGCAVSYNVSIYDNKIVDDFIIKYTEEDTRNKENDEELMGNRLKALIDYDVYPFFEDYTYKYNKKLEKENNINNLVLSYEYNLTDFQNANVIKNCFKNKNIITNGDNIDINLNGYFYCLYNNEEILINVKTNRKVAYNNANLIKDNIYTWKINKDNYKNVDIKLSLISTSDNNVIDKVINNINNYEDEEVSNFMEYIYIFMLAFLLLVLFFVFIKVKTSNKK